MPTATFALAYLQQLTPLEPGDLVRHAFNYGLEATLGSQTLGVEVPADRPDLLSAEGFARVLTLYGQGVGSQGGRSLPPSLAPSGRRIRVDARVMPLRPHIAALVVHHPRLNQGGLESFLQFQDKVSQTYGRQRRKIALGCYDLSQIEGDLVYGAALKEALELVPLGDDRPWSAAEILSRHPKGLRHGGSLPPGDWVPVLWDGAGRVLALPPVVNGAGVGEVGPATEHLLVDVTGTSAQGVQQIANILAHNFLDRGAMVETVAIGYPAEDLGDSARNPGAIASHPQPTPEDPFHWHTTPTLEPQRVPFEAKFLNGVVGTFIAKGELDRYLAPMDLHLEGKNHIQVPTYRTDILSQSDLAGDLLVAVGLDNLEADRSHLAFYTGTPDPLKTLAHDLGDWAQRMGLTEVKSYILTDPALLQGFPGQPLLTTNARTQSHSVTRPSLLPGLLDILAHHINAPKPLNLYEVGEVVQWQGDLGESGTVRESLHWGFASLDAKASFATAKAYIQTLLRAMGVTYGLEPCAESCYIPGRSAWVEVTTPQGEIQRAGHFGEIHPEILHRFSFPEPVCAGELDCQVLAARIKKV